MKNLNRIWRYLGNYKLSIALYVLFTLLGQLFSIVSLGMLAPVLKLLFLGSEPGILPTNPSIVDRFIYFVEQTANNSDKSVTLLLVCCTVVIAVLLKNIFLYLGQYILFPVRHGITRRLRNDMFLKVLSLPIGYFTEEKKGDLVSRMTNDASEVQNSIMSVMDVFVKEPITIIYLLIAMIFISPTLMLGILIILPVAGLLIGKVGSSLRRAARRMSQQWSDITTVLDETISGMRVVKAFNAEKHQYLRFLKLNNENYRERNRVAIRQEAASPMSETLGVILVAGVLWFGGRLVLSKDPDALQPELFLLFIGLLTQIISPFKALSNAINIVQKGIAALGRMEEVLTVQNTITDRPDAQSIRTFTGSIELRNVSFAYGDRKILDNISLTIPHGKTIALVGSSGAGKSTLVDLLPRFHDVSEGEILLDGINLKDYKLDELRRLFGVVGQEPMLFNDTLYNNITLGTGGATQVDVERAATVAHAHDFIVSKPEAYQTEVGDRGAKLSGGERQRITIARAVLKNPPILILDEATSSLDTESERIVQEAIIGLMQSRTSIVIAHRLSTVRNADEIIVLDKGKIVERGTHQELLAQTGTYRKLVEMQQVK